MDFIYFGKYTVALHVLYLVIVLFSLVSISKPYHLSVQILFYIVNGAFVAVYLAFEFTHWVEKQKKQLFVEPKAVSYTRTVATTVIIALMFSILSGYHSFDSYYSYNVKTHMFMFVSNQLLFMTKMEMLFGPHLQFVQAVTFMSIIFYMGVIIVFFEDNTDA